MDKHLPYIHPLLIIHLHTCPFSLTTPSLMAQANSCSLCTLPGVSASNSVLPLISLFIYSNSTRACPLCMAQPVRESSMLRLGSQQSSTTITPEANILQIPYTLLCSMLPLAYLHFQLFKNLFTTLS